MNPNAATSSHCINTVVIFQEINLQGEGSVLHYGQQLQHCTLSQEAWNCYCSDQIWHILYGKVHELGY
nr:hypothetical protein CFP56_77705 [Quercus suber]